MAEMPPDAAAPKPGRAETSSIAALTGCHQSRFPAGRYSRNTSAGVLKPRHLRRVAFMHSHDAFSACGGKLDSTVSRVSQRRTRWFVFSTGGFCDGACGSQEQA